MALSEIEKLERRYAENPQGLTFAPLAEVHRKNGEVQRALDLLGSGLALHPDYIPASIVLGRCHLDLGDVHAAEKAFLHVLSLDGENVIALKALADIGERLLKLEDAERWLRTLLSLDRSNEEAREQLRRVEIARRQAEVGSSVEPDSRVAPEALAGAAPAAAAAGAAAETAPEPPLAFEPPVAEPARGWVSHSTEVSDLSSPPAEALEPSALREPIEDPAGIELPEPGRYDEEVRPLEGLVGREVDVPEEIPGEFRVETSEDIVLQSSGGNEFQVPDASQELFAASPTAERAPFENAPLPPATEASGPVTTESEPPEPELAEPELAAPSTMSESELVPFVPESETALTTSAFDGASAMSVSEPPPAEARELVPAPEQPAMVSEPEPDHAPEIVPIDHYPVPGADHPVPAERAEPAAQPVAAPKRSYAASETGGRPVAQVLKDILSARPPSHAPAPAVRPASSAGGSGAPTRPAADALSLSSVFGEEEAPGTPPAVPAASAGTGVSFDDFFGAPGATPTQRGTRAPDPKNDDLDQFHAWLQNLKR